MNYFGTNAGKGEKLDYLEVEMKILFSWVWENLSGLCNPPDGEK